MMDLRSLEMLVRMTRLLLPFTHGVDTSAIASALALAQRFDATLVPLSLIHLPHTSGRGPRWEDIQQSRDFLEFVQRKATRSGVPVKRMELYTHNPVRSTRVLAQEMECAGIIVAVRQGAGVLLATSEVKGLLENKDLPLYVVSLPGKSSLFTFFRQFKRKITASLSLQQGAGPGDQGASIQSVE